MSGGNRSGHRPARNLAASPCPHCGKAVKAGTFCAVCGKPPESVEAAPVWSVVVGDTLPPIEQLLAEPGQATATCPKCHSPLPPEARFCGACGAKQA